MYWNIWTRSCSFFSASGLTWQAFLKKNEVNLELLTDIDMLIMVEKRIRGVILCQATHGYAKGNNNTWKVIMKTQSHDIWWI